MENRRGTAVVVAMEAVLLLALSAGVVAWAHEEEEHGTPHKLTAPPAVSPEAAPAATPGAAPAEETGGVPADELAEMKREVRWSVAQSVAIIAAVILGAIGLVLIFYAAGRGTQR